MALIQNSIPQGVTACRPAQSAGSKYRVEQPALSRTDSNIVVVIAPGRGAHEPLAWQRLMALYTPLVRQWCRRSGAPSRILRTCPRRCLRSSLRAWRSSTPTGRARRFEPGCADRAAQAMALRTPARRTSDRRHGCPEALPASPRPRRRIRPFGKSGRRHGPLSAGLAPGTRRV